MKQLCTAIFMLVLLTGCGDGPEKPPSLVDEDTYVTLLVELQLVRSYAETGKIDSLQADSLREQVFQKYDVAPASFWQSHEYYQHFPQQQKKRVEKAIEELRMDRVADSSSAGRETRPPD